MTKFYSIILFLIYACDVPQKLDSDVSSEVSINNGSTEKIDTASINFSNSYYLGIQNEILKRFDIRDSLGWDNEGEVVDSAFVGEGSSWRYWIADSLKRYMYGQFGCSGKVESIFYLLNDTLVLHVDRETNYRAPLGYDKELELSEVDSTEYENDLIIEEFSFFKNNEIVKQISADCGAPNAYKYIKFREESILDNLKKINEKLKELK